MAGTLFCAARPTSHAPDPLLLKVGGLTFAIPEHWQVVPPETPARAAQWRVAPPRSQGGDGVEVVVFFFGPGVGGTARENIDAWTAAMSGPDGRPPAAPPRTREVGGHKITQLALSGTYSQVNSQPGLPPALKPNYGLLGAVVENPAGTIYWRLTGPAAQVTALAPVFDKVLDSLKLQEKGP